MAKSTLVPITREYLKKFYVDWPISPVSSDCAELQSRIDEFVERCEPLVRERNERIGPGDLAGYRKGFEQEIPLKIDECLWRNREQIEEMLDLLASKRIKKKMQKAEGFKGGDRRAETKHFKETVEKIIADLKGAYAAFEGYSAQAQEKVTEIMEDFMPKDWRATLVLKHHERGERKKKAAMEKMMADGATIKQKYEVLWKQQMERRETLVSLGNASGMFKFVLRYIGGIPQVLLDFIQKLNHDKGPMEETRLVYGPPIYDLLRHVIALRSFMSLLWRPNVFASIDTWSAAEVANPGTVAGKQNVTVRMYLELLAQNAEVYRRETERYLSRLTAVFQASPFFISADEAAASIQGAASKDMTFKLEATKPLVVEARSMRNVAERLGAKEIPCVIAWKFVVDSKDIDFSVQYKSGKGQEAVVVVPVERCGATKEHEGYQRVDKPGLYALRFDNSYSKMTKKSLKYAFETQPLPDAELSVDSDEEEKEESSESSASETDGDGGDKKSSEESGSMKSDDVSEEEEGGESSGSESEEEEEEEHGRKK